MDQALTDQVGRPDQCVRIEEQPYPVYSWKSPSGSSKRSMDRTVPAVCPIVGLSAIRMAEPRASIARRASHPR